MKVAIITEGLQGTGYGHLTRCLSVYQASEEKGIIPLFIANCDEKGKTFVSDTNLIQLDWVKEQEKLINLINHFDIAIIDSYLAPLEVYQAISNSVKKAVYFDDYMRLDYPPGFIVNGAVGAENLPYKKNDYHKYLLGIDYTPLRKPFWDVVMPEKNSKEIKNVFINFGGQDSGNLTSRILDYLVKEFPELNYLIIYGTEAEQRNECKNVSYYFGLNAEEMLSVMLKCDLAVSAAGQTTYELARLGIPTIAIGTAENQKYNLNGWAKRGFIKEELWSEQNDLPDRLKNQINVLINSFTTEQKVFCDGQGARRIVNQLDYNNDFILRDVKKSDAKLLFDWANDPMMRSNSFTKETIYWADHLKWFDEKLKNPNTRIFIAESKGLPIGQIRYDKKNTYAVIDFSIDKEYRGHGYGSKLLIKSLQRIFDQWPALTYIEGEVKENNVASAKAFIRAGFSEKFKADYLVFRKYNREL